MFTRPDNAQIGDKVAIYRFTPHSKEITFATVTKVSARKVSVDVLGLAFKTSDWGLWGGGERNWRRGEELVDETTGLRLQKQIEDEALCKTIAQDANKVLSTIDTDRFHRYACGWSKVDLRKAIVLRKQAMLEALAEFDKAIATLENM